MTWKKVLELTHPLATMSFSLCCYQAQLINEWSKTWEREERKMQAQPLLLCSFSNSTVKSLLETAIFPGRPGSLLSIRYLCLSSLPEDKDLVFKVGKMWARLFFPWDCQRAVVFLEGWWCPGAHLLGCLPLPRACCHPQEMFWGPDRLRMTSRQPPVAQPRGDGGHFCHPFWPSTCRYLSPDASWKTTV